MERAKALKQLRELSAFGHLAEGKVAALNRHSDSPVEFYCERYASGLGVTYDEGAIRIAHGEIGFITLAEADERLAALERGEEIPGVE